MGSSCGGHGGNAAFAACSPVQCWPRSAPRDSLGLLTLSAASTAMQKIAPRQTGNRVMGIESPVEARRIIRAGEYTGHTAGVAPDCVQGNLCILPKDMAMEFAAFCQRNPKPCPVIGIGAPGDRSLPDLGDIDIRTDVPRYRVFKNGKLVDEPTDIRD